MLAPEEFFSWDRRANRAISHLCPAIDAALETGKATSVQCFPSSYTLPEFSALVTDLCKRAGLNLAVLKTSADTLALVPLETGAELAVLQLRGRRRTPVLS